MKTNKRFQSLNFARFTALYHLPLLLIISAFKNRLFSIKPYIPVKNSKSSTIPIQFLGLGLTLIFFSLNISDYKECWEQVAACKEIVFRHME